MQARLLCRVENRVSRVCGSEQSKASQEGPEEFPMFSLSLHSPTAQLGWKPAEGVSPFFRSSFGILGNSPKFFFTGAFTCAMRTACPLVTQVNEKTDYPGEITRGCISVCCVLSGARWLQISRRFCVAQASDVLDSPTAWQCLAPPRSEAPGTGSHPRDPLSFHSCVSELQL